MPEGFELLSLLPDVEFTENIENWDAVSSKFPLVDEPLRPGWLRSERGVWHGLTPEDVQLPDQGWKIHISATEETSGPVLDTVSEYCFANRIAFKFLRTSRILQAMNHKYTPRSSSGKFITLYPLDDDSLYACLTQLGESLRPYPGPYVLTDCRWEEGPLHFRYGAFHMLWKWTDTGERVLALYNPSGELEADSRQPVFQTPEWVKPPDFLEPHITNRVKGGTEGGDDLGFQPTEALEFSNVGGVYAGTLNDSDLPVVAKEARPLTGGRVDGSDGIARLRHEHRILQELDDLPGVPRSVGMKKVWEHEFLVMERMPGESLQHWMSRNNPLLIWGSFTASGLAEHVRRVEKIWHDVVGLVEAMHARGVAFNDLHPNNIMIDTDHDDSISLIDFEQASLLSEGPTRGMGAPGFFDIDKQGIDLDNHALGVLRTWLYIPVVGHLWLCPERVDALVDEVERLYPVPEDFAQQVRKATRPVEPADRKLRAQGASGRIGAPPALLSPSGLKTDPASLRASLTEAVKATASPEREDRLFPGSYRQFNEAPAGFAHGAAGVLWALWKAGGFRDEGWERWLLDRAHDHRMRPGFYDGAHGTAYVLEELGYSEAALEVVETVTPEVGRMTDATLYSGLAGVGLGLLHQGRTEQAQDIADRLREIVHSGTSVMPPGAKNKGGGLMYGWSGIALFLLRLYEATGESDHYGTAVKALHRDLSLCSYDKQGSLLINDGRRVLPYLEQGSAGLGLVADLSLRHGPDEQIAEALPALVRGWRSPAVALTGSLFLGRIGLMSAAHVLSGVDHGLDVDPVAEHISYLHWEALSFDGHLTFPANGGVRLSMDLASGASGALIGLSSVLGGSHPVLPFLSKASNSTGSTTVEPVRPLTPDL